MSEADGLQHAIHAQTVAALPPAPGAVDAALAACARIGDEVQATVERVTGALGSAGVAAVAEAPIRPRQFHTAELTIERADLADALRVLAEFGFVTAFEPTDRRVEAASRSLPALRVIGFDGVTTRLTLRFAEAAPSRVPAPLRPTVADIGAHDLPAVLAPLSRLERLVRSRIGTQRRPRGDNDYLGTPDSLILPLLAVAETGPDDVVMDLGCGDGRVLVEAAGTLGCRGVGVELNPELAGRATTTVADAGLEDRIEIRCASAESTDLTEASVIFAFLPDGLLPDVIARCLDAAAGGTRILVHEQVELPGPLRPGGPLAPQHSEPVIGHNALTVAHLWRVPAG